MTTQPGHQIAVEEAVAFGFLTAVGGYAFLTAWFDYDLLNEGNRVGPGLVPAVVGGLIALISGALLVLTLTGRRARHDHGLAEVAQSVSADLPAETADLRPEAGDDIDIFGRSPAQRMRQLQMVTVALVVALFLVSVVGLLGALGLFSLFVSILVERRPWLPSVLITAASVGVIYGVFAVFLEVPLPSGSLGIGG
ncbi:MAG: tripartite tricarboxylate transporter TctB family protein [Actinomycetota bacterium]|nr:tripartite tricarboxylate transporter TctB family protein [Actinomycetota bacterium]